MARKWAFLFGIGSAAILVAGCSDDSEPKDSCGNLTCDPGEDALTCPKDCGCNNGILNEGEMCDGSDLGGKSCQDLGYTGGTLRCTAHCTFDTSDCEGGTVCGNGVREGDEQCDKIDLGGATCQDLGFDGGLLGCDPSCQFDTLTCCMDSCPQEGQTRCRGDVVESCLIAQTGCLSWQTTDDCAARQGTCEETQDGAQCNIPCRDRCLEENAKRCSGDVLQQCTKLSEDDCLDWHEVEDCEANGQYCGERNGESQCITPPPGDSCVDPYVVTSFPFELSGSDITIDYQDLYNFSSNTNCGRASGPEAIFAVYLNSGERVRIDENGGLDAVIRVLDTCDATSDCLLSSDEPETGLKYQATHDGTYYVVLEAWSSSPGTTDYDIVIDKEIPEQDCQDGQDNDGDGLTDCDDREDCCDDPVCSTYPACMGDTCGGAIPVRTFPYNISGTDITADFADDYDWSNNTNCTYADGVDAILAVHLLAGERIHMDETGGLDAVIRVLGTCDANSSCLLSSDTPETGLTYRATSDGTYYVVLEAYSSTPWSTDYNFTIDKEPAEQDCQDGQDNDGDGLTDCDDREDCCDDPVCSTYPACMGDTCSDPIPVPTFPYHISGSDITADFADDYDWSSNTNCTYADGVDAILAVYLQSGDILHLDENSGLDAVIRVLDTCDATSSCLLSSDSPETGLTYRASQDGTYFVVLEAYSSSPFSKDYDFTVDRQIPERNCQDGQDNDGDSLTDCDDKADCCFDPVCATNSACLGETCTSAVQVTTFPYEISGSDITADFEDDYDWSHNTGCGTAHGVDAIFAVHLQAGQTLTMDETGSMDAVIRVLDTCDARASCLLSSDTPETGLTYQATQDGTYFVVLEAYFSSPSNKGYDFTIDVQ